VIDIDRVSPNDNQQSSHEIGFEHKRVIAAAAGHETLEVRAWGTQGNRVVEIGAEDIVDPSDNRIVAD
jgi:hypothetical protein